MQAVFPFLNGFKADEGWIYRCPDDLSKMFLRPGTEKTFQGHECFIPGEPGAARFKWGRCVWHRERAMRPYIAPNGEQSSYSYVPLSFSRTISFAEAASSRCLFLDTGTKS